MSKILTSWKDIAAHLGKGVRTVQRWEKEMGLPVRRPSQSKHIVLAYPEELEAWAQTAAPSCASCANYQAEIEKLRAQVRKLEHEYETLQSELHTRTELAS